MPNFTCHKCGHGTLVRSNVRLTPDHKPYCRAEDVCAERQAKKAAPGPEEEGFNKEDDDHA